MSRRCLFCIPVSLLVSALAAMPVAAATINHGNFIGDTVTYLNVTEFNAEPGPLFSVPTVSGDTLEFDPVNFFSAANPGAGVDITDSELSTTIVADSGFFIENMLIHEAGDYTLTGVPGAFASANVGAAFFFQVLAVDGVAVGDGPVGSVSMQFTSGSGPNGGEFSTLTGDTGVSLPWEGTAFIDITSAMDASPYAGQDATSVRVVYENTLSTVAAANASAFIKKKVIGGLTIQTNIPEPGSVVLALLAGVPLVAVALRRRRG
jgi:hypothetical protein